MMQTVLNNLSSFSTWLILTSLKASVVVALIFLVQVTFRKKLSAKWMHALWFLMILRLIIPVDIPTRWSIFNLTHDVDYQNIPLFNIDDKNPLTIQDFQTKDNQSIHTTSLTTHPTKIEQISSMQKNHLTVFQIIEIIWLLVVLSLFFYTLILNIKLSKQINAGRIITDSRILDILEKCKKQLNIKRTIKIITLKDINSPFWFGIFHCQIVMPRNLLDNNNFDKLEHIFMHELVHYKQKDVLLALIATILQILHWFNPVIWFAFFKMRADREAACDELVLTNIGKDKNKQYGRTIISLIESASQRGLLPVAVGLADTKFNLKRRVTMIKNFSPKSIWWTAVALLILSTSAAVVLTGAIQKGNVTGTITFSGASIPDSIYVGIYRLRQSQWHLYPFGDYIAMSTSTNPDFDFQLEPGSYCIAAWAQGYDYAYTNFAVPNEKQKLEFTFDLIPAHLPAHYSDVNLVGDFCSWDAENALPMTFDGSVWRIIPPSHMAKDSEFKFLLRVPKQDSDLYVFHYSYSPGLGKQIVDKPWATFKHVNDGGEIVFDPSLFAVGDKKANIKIKGLGFEQQLNTVYDDYQDFYNSNRETRQSGDASHADQFGSIRAQFEKLKSKYDPQVQIILIEEWFDDFAFNHPFFDLVRKAFSNGKIDSIVYKQALESDEFLDFMNMCQVQLQIIDFFSPLLDGEICDDLLGLDRLLNDAPQEVRQRLNIAKTNFEEILVNVVKQGKGQAPGKILYELIRTYIGMEKYDKAQYYIDWMERDFSDHWYYTNVVKDGLAEEIKLIPGAPAPLFAAPTLDGDYISLSDYKGKFVYIDFWGTWCGPCRAALPHNIELVKTISKDSLVFIGLAKDKESDVRDFLDRQSLPYINAILTDDIEKRYGVTGYPTTYLVDPDGYILARNINGNNLAVRVREKMKLYAAR